MRAFLSRRDLIKSSALAAGVSVLGSPACTTDRGAAAADEQSAGLALVNGRILTLDDSNTIAAAVGIRNGRIVEVGQRVGRYARTIDLKGAAVIPGLIDAHHHLLFASPHLGYEVRRLEVVNSIPEFVQAIAERARTVPAGQFILCEGGWSRTALAEKRVPTLAELDAAAPNHPLWLGEGGTEAEAGMDPVGAGLTNSAGLALFQKHGVKGDPTTGAVPKADGVRVMQELASVDDHRRNIDETIDYLLSLGMTMVHDAGNIVSDPSLEATYPFVIALWRAGKLNLRLRLRGNSPSESGLEGMKARVINSINRLGDDVLRLNGLGEALADAEISIPKFKPIFQEAAMFAAAHGWSVHIHSGDLGENSAHTAVFQAVNAKYPLKDLRWSLAHAPHITPELARQVVEMGVGITADAYMFGSEAVDAMPMGPPYRMLLDAGVNLGCGSDGAGSFRSNPWCSIYYMSTGRIYSGEVANPGQTISRVEALKIQTRGSAWHSFDDHHLGTLEVGKLADLAVLSDDPLTVSDENLRRITSKLTLQAGNVVYQAA